MNTSPSLSLSREADGQGLALGCVLVPTLVCSAIHCTLYTTPHHVG